VLFCSLELYTVYEYGIFFKWCKRLLELSWFSAFIVMAVMDKSKLS